MKYYIGIIKVAALIILLPIILGKSTFSKTIQLHKDYKHIQTLEEQLEQAASEKPVSTPAPVHNQNLVSNGRLVELISRACEGNNVSVKQYEPALLDMEGDYKLYAAILILSGNYVDLVKTLKYCEDNIPSVKISTIQYEYDEKKMKDRKVEMSLSIRQIEE
ncbi:hypothetical protein [Proteiniphilum sp. X52]|uniref:hypothetical protein n=1 Tax=Proteiniphilum sp. X52 TaxID=2382159 RepID=UPI000F0A22BA|nr:hypothetical protein [Proteiniphilum sp. X52]RNC63878.1 hypothetical protein D7D25_14300 [Proteiniphilum sp. X52]